MFFSLYFILMNVIFYLLLLKKIFYLKLNKKNILLEKFFFFMDPEDYHFKFRIVILGDKSVGKTSLLECNININNSS
jgi:hypothetical protein